MLGILSLAPVNLASQAFAQSDEIKATIFRYNHVAHPKSLGDIVLELSQSEIVQAVAVYYGVPKEAIGLLSLAGTVWDKGGEDIRTYYKPDPGYRFCSVRVKQWHSCNGPARLDARIGYDDTENVVLVYSWVQKNRLPFDGRNFVDADIEIIAVRDDLYSQHSCFGHDELNFRRDC